jgi:L-asparaginase
MQLTIFTTGGTLHQVYFDAKGGYQVVTPVVREILEHGRVTDPVLIVELLHKDRLEMTAANRALVLEAVRSGVTDGIIVTHGTDTLVETARVLAAVAGETIARTGALRPGRSADSDGPFNVAMAVATAQTAPPGVYLVANGRAFDSRRVRESRSLNRFESSDE